MSNAVEVVEAVETAAVEVDEVAETEVVAKGKPGRPVTPRGEIGRELKVKSTILSAINKIVNVADADVLERINQAFPEDYIDNLSTTVEDLEAKFENTAKNPKKPNKQS
jgi:hypothetical protein